MGKTHKDSFKNYETREKLREAKTQRPQTRQLIDEYEDFLYEQSIESLAAQDLGQENEDEESEAVESRSTD